MKMIKGDIALTKHIYSSQVDPWLVTRYASQNLNKNQVSMISGFQNRHLPVLCTIIITLFPADTMLCMFCETLISSLWLITSEASYL